jgi:hypothetical protein
LHVIRRGWCLLSGFVIAASLSGCAIYDPWQVWRYHAGYNTERALSAQITFYDHLPPPPVRTRLMQWGYNVTPASTPTAFVIPADAPVAPPVMTPAMPPAPATEMQSVTPPDLLDRSRPPELPPAAPTARAPAEIQQLHQSVAPPAPPPRTAAWLFAPSASR